MITRRWTLRTMLFSAALVLAFLPVGLSADRGIAKSGAQCETCCAQKAATCIVCSKSKCYEFGSYYLGEVGTPCAAQLAPNTPG